MGLTLFFTPNDSKVLITPAQRKLTHRRRSEGRDGRARQGGGGGQIDFTFTICLLDENLRSRWSFGLAVPDLACGAFTNYVDKIF